MIDNNASTDVVINDDHPSGPWVWIMRCYHRTDTHPGLAGVVIAEGSHGWVVDLPEWGRACYARSVRLASGEVLSR